MRSKVEDEELYLCLSVMVDYPCLCDEKVDSNEPSCICLSGVYIQCEKTLMNFELVNNQASSSFASPKLDRPRQCNKLLFNLLPAPAEREDLYPFFLAEAVEQNRAVRISGTIGH